MPSIVFPACTSLLVSSNLSDFLLCLFRILPQKYPPPLHSRNPYPEVGWVIISLQHAGLCQGLFTKHYTSFCQHKIGRLHWNACRLQQLQQLSISILLRFKIQISQKRESERPSLDELATAWEAHDAEQPQLLPLGAPWGQCWKRQGLLWASRFTKSLHRGPKQRQGLT